MGRVLHGNARATPRIREAVQNSNKSLSELARLYNLTPNTVSKWAKRKTIQDGMSGGNRSFVL